MHHASYVLLARTPIRSSPRSIGWGTYHPLTRKRNYYLGIVVQSTTATELVSSVANIQAWLSSTKVCILHHNIVFISKGVKLGGDRKIPAIFLSFYVACITIQNPWSQTRSPRTSSRSLRAIMFHHLCTVSHKEIPYLENTDDINNKCLCTRSTIMTNVSFWGQISSNLTVF